MYSSVQLAATNGKVHAVKGTQGLLKLQPQGADDLKLLKSPLLELLAGTNQKDGADRRDLRCPAFHPLILSILPYAVRECIGINEICRK